ncbi:DEAD/DEAH box helicase [Pseudoalteromonas piscicida]|uniref:DEAD/DEAH box helicase n=1 Tax=Pseudoalteromonas piscicida TaxID=43662 RepID=UPI000E35D23E|nr:DEAD/DEAH box helicase [Pseudoalteromonas piscicida]AXQ98340.1 DEAD/DEAH box helicase [Pseudoalteromonas piscicida]
MNFDFPPAINEEITALINQVHNLPVHEQTLLSVLAVVYKPVSAIKLKRLIQALVAKEIIPENDFEQGVSHSQIMKWRSDGLVTFNEDGVQINLKLATSLSHRVMANGQFLAILNAAEEFIPVLNAYEWERQFADEQRLIRDFLFINQLPKARNHLGLAKDPQAVCHKTNQVLLPLYFYPFSVEGFSALPDDLQYQAFATLLYTLLQGGHSISYALEILTQVQAKTQSPQLTCLLAEYQIYTMQLDKAQALVANIQTAYSAQIMASIAFLQQYDDLIVCFEQALKAKNKITKRKKQYLGRTLGLFHKLALLQQANSHDAALFGTLSQQLEFESQDSKAPYNNFFANNVLLYCAESLSQNSSYSSAHLNYSSLKKSHVFDYYLGRLLDCFAHFWCNQSLDAKALASLDDCIATFERLSLPLFAGLAKQLMLAQHGEQYPLPFNPELNVSHLVAKKTAWDLALDKLIALNPNANTSQEVGEQFRLIWQIRQGRFDIEFLAREQKRGKTGWGKGKPISCKQLKQHPEQFSYISQSDKKLIDAIAPQSGYGYNGRADYALAGIPALKAAVGATNLYHEDDLKQAITIAEKSPELHIRQHGDDLLLSIPNLPSYFGQPQTYSFIQQAEHHYEFIVFNQSHIQVAEIIGESGLTVPASAKQKVLSSIKAIAPYLNVQSDLADIDTGLDSIEAQSALVINIQPYHQGLDFHCVVMPFGEKGPIFHPGHGIATVSAEIDGKRLSTTRNLLLEQQRLDELDTHCPLFLEMTDNRLSLAEMDEALEVLQELELVINQEPCPMALKLRWPKGKKVKLSSKLESQHLQLAMSKKNEWFDMTGELQVSNDQVIELKQLLKMVATSNGRFIALDGEQVLALSSELKAQLDQLNNATEGGKFHPLAAPLIAEATTGMRMKTLPAWEAQNEKMQQAVALTPELPSTLQAELRDYQQAGFDWAMRLAHWGAGACLADDMGLGKTIQALAMILARANVGPTLVIAPTSVCFNWQQEIQKFAPTLSVKLFSDYPHSDARAEMLSNLQPLDCVIISYGLLQREVDILKSIAFETIVADEAQALKNPLAKRTQAACALKGKFKLITTGTPIENNLTELWSLFRFVNPGLLGNLKRFSEKFSAPIENANEDKLAAHRARKGLKHLIQPFILRRMKHQVLTELPPRTEINVPIQLSQEEQTFYEALRQNAIDEISQSTQQDSANEQRFKMLAALTRLRQACCHPKLLMAESQITSSKLAALDELLTELQENNHKALIFSQFVGHLQLIKSRLEKRGIRFQYLDGSTPSKARQQAVNAFQKGEGEVFLISLKAGGSGLNLTAADYVIHMDPWWNPAVEEQASDRVHRMGQTRPVTIYRLIAKGTIEEQIVELHHHKKDLADQLLSNTDKVMKLDVNDVLSMLKETL